MVSLCIGHAGLFTGIVVYGVNHPGSAFFNIYLSLAVLISWPFWALVFWKLGRQVEDIILTMIFGVFILSPGLFHIVLLSNFIWALSLRG